MSDKQIEEIVSDTVKKILTETSCRQKATMKFLGVNNKVKTFGIITAENPMGMKISSQENEKQNKMLVSFLRSRQYAFYPAIGKYSNIDIEHPLLVFNVSLEDMKTIGSTFDQESFIYAEMNHEQGQPHVMFSHFQKRFSENDKMNNGAKIKPSEREYRFIGKKDIYTPIDAETDGCFTAIGRNFKFSIPFDIFNEAVDKYNNFVNERCQKHEKYNIMCGKRIDESIQSNRTDRSRRVRRAELYGANYEKFL